MDSAGEIIVGVVVMALFILYVVKRSKKAKPMSSRERYDRDRYFAEHLEQSEVVSDDGGGSDDD